jgi:hypothetical protein
MNMEVFQWLTLIGIAMVFLALRRVGTLLTDIMKALDTLTPADAPKLSEWRIL